MMKYKLLIIGIFLLASFFRLYGVNWDQGQHLHPDERFLTMVATDISWPKDLGEYLDTAISPLNPHNRGFGFFVYGTFPVFFTKWIAETLGKGDYGNLTLIGRQLSAIVDLGTVLLVFLIAKRINSKFEYRNSKQYQNSNDKNSKRFQRSNFENSSLFRASDFGFRIFPLIPMFLYSIMVLPIQLSHFYAVETYLTFFIALSFYLLIKLITDRQGKTVTNSTTILYSNVVLLGISFGLALASKITAILFLPIIGLGFLIILIRTRNLKTVFVLCSLFFVLCFITFRLAQPYAFANGNIFDPTLNLKLVENWRQLEGFMKPDSGFPPSVQWFGITPFLFPFASLVLWGLGLPLGIISILAIMYLIWSLGHWVIWLLKRKQSTINNQQLTILFSLFWVLLLFIYQSFQPAPTIRYFLPIYPFLAIVSGYFLYVILGSVSDSRIFKWMKLRDSEQARMTTKFVYLFICLLLVVYPLSFLSIYSRPHSRVTASEWIYNNIPIGSTIATEHWDDGLPMTIDIRRISQLYKYVSLPLYDPDRVEKWPKIAKILEGADYIVLSSNRLWGSITKAPKLFPQTSKYYRYLFDGSLGFEKIAETTSFPSLPIPLGKNCLYLGPPQEERLGLKTDKGGSIRIDRCNIYEGTDYKGIVIRDEISEETFTVYDHPKVLIFKKVKSVDYLKLLDDYNYRK